jgi:predicted DsbA family dithiol-disulfide isomerase
MTETPSVSRRRLLAAGGVGLGLAAAGCMAPGSERRATAFLQRSEDAQAELRTQNQQLRQELQNGSISRQEAGQQVSELRGELNDELVDSATTEAESLGLTVEDSITPPSGSPLLLVSGSESALLDYMNVDMVTGLTSPDQFEELQQQRAQAANQTTQPTG